MAEEIEKYLLEKLAAAIKEEGTNEQHPSNKWFRMHFHFEKLKEMLENKASSSLAADESTRRAKLYYLNNLLAEWQMLSKKQSSYSPEALVFAYNLSRSLKKIIRELKPRDSSGAPDRNSSPQDDNTAILPKEMKTYRWSTRFVDPTKVYGLEDKVISMERLLIRPEGNYAFKAIGIVGMRGIGKTTLSQLIFSREKVKRHFLPRIWVCLSKKPNEEDDNRKEIVKRMLVCLGVEEDIIKDADENHGLLGLLFALRIHLRWKRFLIFLDDAWNSDEFFEKLDSAEEKPVERLAYGLPKGSGGTVIVISRAKEIAESMVGEENIYSVPSVDKESSWLIFKDWVEEDGKEFPQELEILKEEIVKRCDGLPLAAKMMGQIMKEQPKGNLTANGSNQQQTHQEQKRPTHQTPT